MNLRILFFWLCIVALLFTAGCTQPSSPAGSTTVSPSAPAAVPSATAISATPDAAASSAPSGSATPATTPVILNRGTVDPDFIVDISVPEKISPGTTLLADNHDPANPRIVEVNQLGGIVWEYPLPAELKSYNNPGWDVELLPNGNILTVIPRWGVYEISRDKKIVWKYLDPKVSHDVERLANGNTLVTFGAADTKNDAQVKEVDPKGNTVWSWHAGDFFDRAPYASISDEGWTHTNAATRLANGNTLISLRNFNIIVEVDPKGNPVRTIGEKLLTSQHDPEIQPNGNILLANQGIPMEALELDTNGAVVWRYPIKERYSWPVRDVDRLPNGDTLITAGDRIIEVTPDKQVVWQFRLTIPHFTDQMSATSRGFYKAQRIYG
ncbi:aryl-sulfate sulfotransferase [uncultured Methanoregula sp.]|uniref:aryl-sulfate sulfotransferase n=1 Tax=uncultured Methanoregula sp. TaxID=1005933 RepID=UPI002AAB3BDB|nr:aryl-sulfate sulfotransferase [uncultured Methanoregula sp.]